MFDFPRSFLFYKDLWDREKSNWLLRKKISHPGFCQGGRFVICREKVFSCLFCFVDMLKPIVTAQCLTGRTASSAGTQCLSRLRRAHSAFRAYGGHAVPSAPTAGTQCLPRLRRTRSVFSRLRRPLRKQTAKGLFSAPYGKALQKQEKPPKDRKPSFRISCEKEKH